MQETEYRKLIQATFHRIEKAFEDVDPDLAECENSMGALTIRFADGSKCIFSAQPSVRQLWMALAARGTAYHFNYDETLKQWRDDKGRDVEVISFLKGYVRENAGLEIEISDA